MRLARCCLPLPAAYYVQAECAVEPAAARVCTLRAVHDWHAAQQQTSEQLGTMQDTVHAAPSIFVCDAACDGNEESTPWDCCI
jgi:hypothetical protein